MGEAAGDAAGLSCLLISASRASAGDGMRAAAANDTWRRGAPAEPALPAGVLKDAARSAARRQRLVGADCSVGMAAGEPPPRGAAVGVVLLLRPAPKPAASPAPRSGSVAAGATASAVWLRRRALMATRPGVAAGCCSRSSSEATSCHGEE